MTDLAHSGSASIPGGDEATGATMLERAARAIHDVDQRRDPIVPDWERVSQDAYMSMARAVLMAVREASDDTLDGQCFRDMLDDILADGEGR